MNPSAASIGRALQIEREKRGYPPACLIGGSPLKLWLMHANVLGLRFETIIDAARYLEAADALAEEGYSDDE